MDVVSDRFLHGRKLRALTLIDECGRYCLAVDPAFSYPSISVVRRLDDVANQFGFPSALREDNGPEFIASEVVPNSGGSMRMS